MREVLLLPFVADSRPEGRPQGRIPAGSTMYLVCTASWPAFPLQSAANMSSGAVSGSSSSSAQGSGFGSGPGFSQSPSPGFPLGAARSADFEWFHNGQPVNARGSGSSQLRQQQQQLAARQPFPSVPVVESHQEPAANRFTSTLRIERVDASCSGEYHCRVRVRFPGAKAEGIEVKSESGRIFVIVSASKGTALLILVITNRHICCSVVFA